MAYSNALDQYLILTNCAKARYSDYCDGLDNSAPTVNAGNLAEGALTLVRIAASPRS